MTEREKQLLAEIERLTKLVEVMAETIKSLSVSNDEMAAQIEELRNTIHTLTEQQNKDSHNSSKPPSSDGFKRNNKSLRGKSGKSQGGQPGHKGSTLNIDAKPDNIVPHHPIPCEGCPHAAECKSHACLAETRTVVDVVVKTDVTAHEVYEIDCPLHGGRLRGQFPEGVNAPIQYGNNLQALVVSFNTLGAVSINRIHEIFGGVFNIPLSTGVINAMVNRCADKLTGTLAAICELVKTAPVVHADETGTHIDGKGRYFHSACTNNLTYIYLGPKRGYKSILAAEVISSVTGILVHDCYSTYWKFDNIVMHALCNAHIQREVIGIMENYPEQEWPQRFLDLLLSMKNAVEKAKAKGKAELSGYYLRKFSKEYDEIMELAYSENPEPEQDPGKRRGRKKRGKVLSLIDRLSKHKASVCLFTKNFAVPYDNNLAERSFRHVKTKTKVSGGFRSENGARSYAAVMSYVDTARKRGRNAFEAILHAIKGESSYIFQYA